MTCLCCERELTKIDVGQQYDKWLYECINPKCVRYALLSTRTQEGHHDAIGEDWKKLSYTPLIYSEIEKFSSLAAEHGTDVPEGEVERIRELFE